jgi:hypothetical protein
MTMARTILGLALGLTSLLVLSNVSSAANSCLLNARADFKSCNADCKGELKDDVAICRGHDPVCAQTCRDGRDECTGPIIQANLTSCLDQCEPPLDAARATCQTQVGCGGGNGPCGFNPAYIACINPAQAIAFACRDTCRDAFKLNSTAQDALQACQDSYKACVTACPPPPAP